MTKERFEKEAESYATRECCTTCKNINHFCKEKCECWSFAKKGAEFGYSKANKQLTKAKELLTRFVMASVYFNGKEADLIKEAEQFLINIERYESDYE